MLTFFSTEVNCTRNSITCVFLSVSQQQEVLAWLLEPLSKQWIQLDWQTACFSDPIGLVKLLSDRAFMWSIFHTVTFFEKALKRSGTKKGIVSSVNSSSTGGINSLHPMTPHLSWMLPPLLRVSANKQ